MPKRQTTKKSRRRNRLPLVRYRILTSIVVFMALLGGISGGLRAQLSQPVNVLAYATNVSQSGLLSSTNQQRIDNDLPSLVLNTKLNSAAQAKANDMVDKDYWSHTSPDGRLPWSFISAAGYSYSTAGENLAYGALTSSQTVDAWMNSPGHRANILNNTFSEVGFGYANSVDYQQSGEQTIVVAMYASPYSAPAPTPIPSSAPVTLDKPIVSSDATGDKIADASAAPTTPAKEPDATKETSAPTTRVKQGQPPTVTPVAETEPIRRIEVVTGIYSGWIVAGALMSGVVAAGTFLYRHSKAWHRRIVKGEQFVVHHPLIDVIAVISIILVVVLLQTVGRIL